MCFLDGSPVEEDPMKHITARQWETDMCHAPVNNCPACCVAALCPCCCTIYLRYEVLQHDMTKYQCCQGYIFRKCTEPICGGCEKDLGWPLLCCEAWCCEGCAISATRIYLQEERQIMTDPCDNRIIRFNNFMQILSCICHILAMFMEELQGIAELVDCIAQIVYMITSACMQAQTQLELKRHPTVNDYTGGTAQGNALVSSQPASQAQQQPPVQAGYPPQQPGYPPQQPGYPPQQPGYPPQQPGYPPQQPGYPPQQPGYPPQQPGYPPQQPGYPPQQPGYPPQQPGYPPQQGYPAGAPPPHY